MRKLSPQSIVAITCMFGMFMQNLDTTIVNVALPRLGEEFAAGHELLGWVVTGYILSLAVWIPAAGWVGDRFGTKRTFLGATVAFIAGSALCGLAWSIETLIFFRVLQGVGGGLLIPVGTAMLFRAFPPAERAKAASLVTIPALIAPMLGPVLGGFLADHASWRWIFLINLPVGVIGLAFAWIALAEHREPRAGKFDPWGFGLSAAGLALILFALSRAPHDGWLAPQTLLLGLLGLGLCGLLVVCELRSREPMLDFRLLGDEMFRTTTLILFLTMASFSGVFFLLPLFLQEVRGLTAFESGLTTFLQPAAMMVTLRFAGPIWRRIGLRRTLVLGLAGVAIGSGLMAVVDLETDQWWVRAIMILRGASIAVTIIPIQAATFQTIRPEKMGRASSLSSANRQVASALGVATIATVLSGQIAALAAAAGVDPAAVPAALAQQVSLPAYHLAFAVGATFAAVGAALSLLIRERTGVTASADPRPGRPPQPEPRPTRAGLESTS